MPEFENNPLQKLAFNTRDADETIELGGLDPARALARVEALIEQAPRGRRYLLRFEPARGDGRETLFQPLGRLLLEARRAGRLASCLPAADGAGYLISR
jgi:hypothetical protein